MEVKVFDYGERVEFQVHNMKSKRLKPQTIWIRTLDAKRLYRGLKDIFDPQEEEICHPAK